MTHPDQETLVGLALGEEDDAALAAHVRSCATCRGAVGRTRDLLGVVERTDGAAIPLESPPPHVWTAVRSAVEPDGPPAVLDAPRRTSNRRPRLAAAAGLAVGVAATIGAFLVLDDDPAPPPSPPVARATTVAAGPVRGIAPATVSGSAEVLEQSGSRRLHLEVAELPEDPDAYVQAWLFDPTTNEMVAIGVMDTDDESFAVPASIDLSVFSSVDLSLEPVDGNPSHSATSLARGTLTPTS